MILVLGCIQNQIFVFKVVWGHEHECRLTPEHKDLGEGKEIFIRYYSYITLALGVSFSSCQRNLIKTFQIEAMISLIKKKVLIFSRDLLNGQK